MLFKGFNVGSEGNRGMLTEFLINSYVRHIVFLSLLFDFIILFLALCREVRLSFA